MRSALILAFGLMATPAWANFLSIKCASSDGTLKYTLWESWDHPRTETWEQNGQPVEVRVTEISPRTVLERNEPPYPAMVASADWAVKVRVEKQREPFDTWMICRTVSGI